MNQDRLKLHGILSDIDNQTSLLVFFIGIFRQDLNKAGSKMANASFGLFSSFGPCMIVLGNKPDSSDKHNWEEDKESGNLQYVQQTAGNRTNRPV